jgi:hypothetical protein
MALASHPSEGRWCPLMERLVTQLTWLQASRLKSGERVVFAETHDIFPEALVPQGTKATVTENELNETSCALWVKPDDIDLQKALSEWEGDIQLTPPLDREMGNREPTWDELSPPATIAKEA